VLATAIYRMLLRNVRLFNAGTRLLVRKIYTKQRLNCVALTEDNYEAAVVAQVGGCLIFVRIVLSAAHCLNTVDFRLLQAKLNARQTKKRCKAKMKSGALWIKLKVRVHPGMVFRLLMSVKHFVCMYACME
jgi:hypothetical protein